jgi:hypothetical protein
LGRDVGGTGRRWGMVAVIGPRSGVRRGWSDSLSGIPIVWRYALGEPSDIDRQELQRLRLERQSDHGRTALTA